MEGVAGDRGIGSVRMLWEIGSKLCVETHFVVRRLVVVRGGYDAFGEGECYGILGAV